MKEGITDCIILACLEAKRSVSFKMLCDLLVFLKQHLGQITAKTIRLLIILYILVLLIGISNRNVNISFRSMIHSCILIDDNNNLANSALQNNPLGELFVFDKCGFSGLAQCFVFVCYFSFDGFVLL